MDRGIFTISLDFELHWGVSEKRTVESYRENLEGVRPAITKMLQLFDAYNIHATWAIVGMLFCNSKDEMNTYIESIDKPVYTNKKLCNFSLANHIGQNVLEDPFHYAPDMIPVISSYKNQEIATHTFSHYYCQEDGQKLQNFETDLDAAISIAKTRDINIESIIFPRNQFTSPYLDACFKRGIKVYRGKQKSWIYYGSSSIRRVARLLDAYLNVSGRNIYNLKRHSGEKIYNVPASRLLRPYSKSLSFLEPLKVKKIKNEMTAAAKQNKLYHLWWHPHNFGKNLEENIKGLENILERYSILHSKFDFASMNMSEIEKYFLS